MALIVPLTIPATTALIDGAVVDIPETVYPTAYARVLVSRAQADMSHICVCWYADTAARFSGVDPVKVYEFATKTRTLVGDYFPAVYAFLKTLPEFEGATDHPFVDPAEVVEPEPTQPEAQA